MLDIGPSPEGVWLEEAYQRLAGIGAWIRVNGESVYSTHPLSPYRQGKWAFTTNEKAGYATYLPDDTENVLPDTVSIPAAMVSAKAGIVLLGEERSLKWKREGDRVVIGIPAVIRQRTAGQPAWVFKVTL